MAIGGLRAEKVNSHKAEVAEKPPTTKFIKKRDLVLVAHGPVLEMVKWAAVKFKLYGPVKVETANCSKQELTYLSANNSRFAIHACK